MVDLQSNEKFDFLWKTYIFIENNIMIYKYEIVNYANNQIFDLYEYNDGQRYKRFRISKGALMELLTPNEKQMFSSGSLKFFRGDDRTVLQKSMIVF